MIRWILTLIAAGTFLASLAAPALAQRPAPPKAHAPKPDTPKNVPKGGTNQGQDELVVKRIDKASPTLMKADAPKADAPKADTAKPDAGKAMNKPAKAPDQPPAEPADGVTMKWNLKENKEGVTAVDLEGKEK